MVEIAAAIEDMYVQVQRKGRGMYVIPNREYIYGTKWERDEHGLLIGAKWIEKLTDAEYVAYVFKTFIPTQL